jgi:DNA-directed RNA polymerase specialized sigma24 family protein
MTETDRARLAELMARFADGDLGALVPFIHTFGGALARVIRRHLSDLGRWDVAGDRHQVDELVQECALELAERAGAWDPAGALPWVWADRAIRQIIIRYVGHPSVEFDPHRHDEVDVTMCEAAIEVKFEDLVRRHPELDLLLQAIAQVGSDRDRAVHLQYRIQKGLGDMSPAHTVGAEFGLAPDHVRQIDRRMRVRLAQLIERDPQYAPLAELRWLVA